MPQTPAAAAALYRPRPAHNQLKEIVEDSLEELSRVWDDRFQEKYGALPARVRRLLERFLRCGDLHFGFLRLRCINPNCPEKTERLVPTSCKVRGLCPSCGQKRALLWAERMVEEVLPLAPYRQLVFTIPRNLRPAFLRDRSLYGDLCRVAYASTRDFLRAQAPRGFPKFQKATPAMVIVPQSFGDLLISHPHAHSVVSLGLYTRDGSFLRMEDIDFSSLEEIFRERFLEMMLRRGKILPDTAEVMRSWEHSGFNLGWDRKLEADDRKGLQGLLSYMERAPVSLRRLRYLDDGMVHYQGTQVHPRLGIDHQLLSPVEFLALLVPHILLRYQVTTRLYGAISTRTRPRLGWIEHPPTHKPPPEYGPPPDSGLSLLPSAAGPALQNEARPPGPGISNQEADDESPVRKERRRSWARLIHRTWLCDPELCPVCGQRMKVIAAIMSPAQDALIEKILRCIGRWNPPWLQKRKARGPPPTRLNSSTEGRRPDLPDPDPEFDLSDRLPTDEDYSVDAPASDDFAG
jgi:hypothetical protein